VKDEHFGKLGEPVNFVQNGSVKGSLSHLYCVFLSEHFLFGICSGKSIKKSIPLRIGMLFLAFISQTKHIYNQTWLFVFDN
jgi:hypothetical protein